MGDCTQAFGVGLGAGMLFGLLLGMVIGAAAEDALDLLNIRNRHRRRTKR